MKLFGWGKYPVIQVEESYFESIEQLKSKLSIPGDYIVHGMGRSYGDSALNRRVIFSSKFNKILNFDPINGVVICESGMTISELIEVFLPRGWFLSVTPGTKFITVGGAIASDVHGKNHHKAGCFSEFVRSFDLMLSNGEIVHCTRENNSELFRATCGGMGLTGIILTVKLKLQQIQSSFIRETLISCKNLEEIFNLFEEHSLVTYSVAWIDCLAKGKNLGRSILMLGEHEDSGKLNHSFKQKWMVPFDLPHICLNRYSVSLFNHFYYNLTPKYIREHLVRIDNFFYPLDKIAHWNRLYGHRGFTQYQLVLSKESSFEGLKKILQMIGASGLGSFLAVLKLFGTQNDNYLSFPKKGYTLALDFKIHPKLFSFLRELDRVVLDHEGRLYLAKDVRMAREVFIKGYPKYEKFEELREMMEMKMKFNSLQSKRLGV